MRRRRQGILRNRSVFWSAIVDLRAAYGEEHRPSRFYRTAQGRCARMPKKRSEGGGMAPMGRVALHICRGCTIPPDHGSNRREVLHVASVFECRGHGGAAPRLAAALRIPLNQGCAGRRPGALQALGAFLCTRWVRQEACPRIRPIPSVNERKSSSTVPNRR